MVDVEVEALGDVLGGFVVRDPVEPPYFPTLLPLIISTARPFLFIIYQQNNTPTHKTLIPPPP